MTPGRRRGQRGAAEVLQFAVVAPIALMLLVGLVELSLGFSYQAILTNASRAAAREAIRTTSQCIDERPFRREAEKAAVAAANSILGWDGSGSLTADMIQVTPDAYCSASEGDQVTVTITYPYSFRFLPAFLDGIADINLVARTRMRALPR